MKQFILLGFLILAFTQQSLADTSIIESAALKRVTIHNFNTDGIVKYLFNKAIKNKYFKNRVIKDKTNINNVSNVKTTVLLEQEAEVRFKYLSKLIKRSESSNGYSLELLIDSNSTYKEKEDSLELKGRVANEMIQLLSILEIDKEDKELSEVMDCFEQKPTGTCNIKLK